MRRRILSLILCLALVVSLLPAVTSPVKAATADQNNIVARADYLYNITWLCQKTVYGWRGNYVFNAGTSYRLPYGQPINSGAYIGFGVSVDSFLAATEDASGVFYTSRSTYGTASSVYYALDCSAFVSWCWGTGRNTTSSIPQISTNLGKPTTANISKLQLGDALNSSSAGHVVLVTGLTYSGSVITQIEITEQTPPQLKRSYYTPSELASEYSGSYTIQRYSGTVPAAPGSAATEKYYPACDSSCTSIVTGLTSIGVDSSKAYRTKIALANGITDYSGTAEQNIRLLSLLKAGQLIDPEYKEPEQAVYYPACDPSCTTLIEALSSIGVDSSKEYRTKIAAANGITDYSGTYDQNIQLLSLLKAGQLIDPEVASGEDTDTEPNGYDRGYAGGMAGDGRIYAHGLDVSKWQGADLDFDAIKAAGYDYVILRAGTTNGKDECFETFYTNARAAGLDIGAYYYTYATTVAAAQSDAGNMLSWISGKTFEYPIYFDYEDPCQDSLSTAMAKDICLTFCDAMAEAGYLAGVYTGYARSTQLPMEEICAKYEVWIARYFDGTYETLTPEYSKLYGMYQYTDCNYIGTAGPFDANVAYKDYPAIVEQYGFNGYDRLEDYLKECTVYPTHCRVTTTETANLNTLPCNVTSSHGSRILEQVEAGSSYIAKALYLNAAGNYWYQITLESGETAYLYSGQAKFEESIDTDLSIVDAAAPGTLLPGSSFEISGDVRAVLNRLDQVRVSINTWEELKATATAKAGDNICQLAGLSLDFSALTSGSYEYTITADYAGYYAASAKELATYSGTAILLQATFEVSECEHSYTTQVIQTETCTVPGILELTCTKCGETLRNTVDPTGHNYIITVQEPTCVDAGMKTYLCTRCDHSITEPISATGHSYLTVTEPATCTQNGSIQSTCSACGDTQSVPILATGHSFENGSCSTCGAEDPDAVPEVTQPILTLKSPTLEFKDMITVNAFYTAENIQDVVEMGMITYSTKVASWSVETAEHIIPGATYVDGRYYSSSQGIHAKYLGDTVYLAIYAKLSDGSYAYSKLAGYSAVQYATSQLKNSADPQLKQLVAAMLNYGAEAQRYFDHNTGSLANASLTADQKALPEAYRADMVGSVPAASTAKQGSFANNQGFASRKPAISFEGAFCINYFFTPKYAPSSGITLYYWNAEDYNAAEVLTAANATGSFKLEGSGTGEYRGDITGISAKALSQAVYVAASYQNGSDTWTSGVLGYSIGSYCSSQASKGTDVSALAMATAVYGYHAKQYFG